MFFRFGGAIVLAVLISLTGVGLEKRNLELRRAVSQQEYQRELLVERQARVRAETQKLGAPPRLLEALEAGKLRMREVEQPIMPKSKSKTRKRGAA
ncbi:MAG: hypothetical protein HZA46_14250 [Planctomycetales bacterium]|jgi:hypothetical protein|nr:hypothetical protein [Planctomycetales bacterium]